MKLSIIIPTYEMHGRGIEFLTRALESIQKQSFKDYEIIVTDNSDNDEIRNLCRIWEQIMPVKYVKCIHKGITKNTNNGIRLAEGELIRILNQDDYLAHENALQDTIDAFEGQWLIVGCDNNPEPYWTGNIHQGNNKLGGPSVLTIRNDHPMLFDEEMRWLFDCDYYKRMHIMYGEPKILAGVNVCIGVGDHQVTNNLPDSAKQGEVMFMTNKYANNAIL